MGSAAPGDLAARLAANVRALRDGRGLTQAQLAKLSGLPRATWANLESGAANPTLAVLHRVAVALQVSLEELIAAPKTGTRFHPRDSLPTRQRGDASVRKLLPERIAGAEIDRIELPPGGRMVGVPHTPGTREFLTCERGSLVLTASGETWALAEGDVVAFRGDQRHAYANPGRGVAVGWSVVMLEPPA
ncbi:MAG: XRE family transcriptional regulator [Polyangiales bacterium]